MGDAVICFACPHPCPSSPDRLDGVANTDTFGLRAYLRSVLPHLGDWPINRVRELTPTAWKAAQAKPA